MAPRKSRPSGEMMTRRVDRVASASVHPVVLSSAHLRMLILMTCVMLASWYINGITYNRCEEADPSDFDGRQIVTVFHNELAAADREDTLYLRSVTCRNSTADTAFSAVVTYNTTTVTTPVRVTWYERDVLRCLKEENSGRESIRNQLIFVGVLVLIATFAMIAALGTRHNESSGHIKISFAQTIVFLFSMGLLIYAIAQIQDALYFEHEDDSKRDFEAGHTHITMAAWVTTIFGVLYGVGYGILTAASAGLITNQMLINLANGIAKTTPSQSESEYDKTFAAAKPQQRLIRTDGMWAIARHETLLYMTLFTVLSIIFFAAENVHSDAPGTHFNQTVHGFGMVSDNSSSITCASDLPFTMQVDLHNEVVSAQHQMKHNMKDHGKASIALLVIVLVVGLAETIWSIYLYVQTDTLVQPSGGDGIFDIFTSIIPLISHTTSTLFSAVPIVSTGLILFYDFQHSDKHHIDKLQGMTFANSVFTTFSALVHYALFVIYVSHYVVGFSKRSNN